jgi:rhodanese-related sulfurtransferase
MQTQEREIRLQKQWFEAKLASEKKKMEVVAKVREGKGDFVLLDARDRASYEKEHLPGAISMPLAEVENAYRQLDASKEHVTYCWNST